MRRLPGWLAPVLVPAILVAALGCREDAESPTAPEPAPALATTATTALSFRQVSGGGAHTCGLTADNQAYCWGWNGYGQLGDGTNTGPETCTVANSAAPCSTRPVAVLGGLRFRQLGAGTYHTCGVTMDYRAYCWGGNSTGQLGDGTTTNRLTPVPVAGGRQFRRVDAGDSHTCGVSYPDNRAYCWGWNRAGQLGVGTNTGPETCTITVIGGTITTPCSTKPVAVRGGLLFRHVAAGVYHTCGVTTTNQAYCWGANGSGQLGDSTEVVQRLRPSQVAGGRQFRQVDVGFEHTCGVTTSDRAFCWGNGASGQLGNGKTYKSFWPRLVFGGVYFDRISAGQNHTCGEATDNRAYCWGVDGLGDGTTTKQLRPVPVAGGLTFSQVSAGSFHTCAKTPASLAYCWGLNSSGELGDGTTTDRLTPVRVAGPAP